MPTDFDSPWKEALNLYFEQFLALLFPEIHTRIDWFRGFESLDKEFHQVVREAELGPRTVDKLVKIWTLEGEERWVLIHVEVQTTPESNFPERMYVYNYRFFDRYNRSVASIAVHRCGKVSRPYHSNDRRSPRHSDTIETFGLSRWQEVWRPCHNAGELSDHERSR